MQAPEFDFDKLCVFKGVSIKFHTIHSSYAWSRLGVQIHINAVEITGARAKDQSHAHGFR